jgi:hypothetical protein
MTGPMTEALNRMTEPALDVLLLDICRAERVPHETLHVHTKSQAVRKALRGRLIP